MSAVVQGQELLPCPFCGGRAEPDTDDLNCHAVRCMDCTIVLGAYSTAKSAATNWNRRAPDLLAPLAQSIGIVRENAELKERVANYDAAVTEACARLKALEADRDHYKARRERMEARDEKLQIVAALAEELCNAIDRAEEDIGGSRPVKDILAHLGPATDEALALVRKDAVISDQVKP